MATSVQLPKDTFIYRIDFSEDLFLSTAPNYAAGAPPTKPLYHVTSAPGHAILSSTRGTTSLSDIPHVQLYSGPSTDYQIFGRGWYDGPYTSFVALDKNDEAGKGTDERIELYATHDQTIGQSFNISYSLWNQIQYNGRTYRIEIGATDKSDKIWSDYLHPEAVMIEGNQFYLAGFEIQVGGPEDDDWKTLCAYTGAKTSMRYNPKRVFGIVRWEEGDWVDEEAKLFGMTVIMVITEQARRMALAEANDKGYSCVVS